MAGIDKTYVDNYKDYKDVIDYAHKTKFECPNGIIINLSDYLYSEISKEDFEKHLKEFPGSSCPVMNTPEEVDYFLIKYCPLKVIQDRMKEVYSTEYVYAIKNGQSKFDKFVKSKPGKHYQIIVKPTIYKQRKFYSNYFHKYVKLGYKIHVEGMKYSDEYDRWLENGELGIWNTDVAHTNCKSFKSIIRKIMSLKLPIGSIVKVCGSYLENDFTLMITK